MSLERTIFIDCSETGPLQPNFRKLKIAYESKYKNGFFSRLSLRAPNLQDFEFGIEWPDDDSSSGGPSDELYDVLMPFTDFKMLFVKVYLKRHQDITLKITTKKYNNDFCSCTTITQYYHHHYVSAASMPLYKNYQFNLIHTCDKFCQHSDQDMICRSSPSHTSLFLRIQCSSFQIIKVSSIVTTVTCEILPASL